LSNINRILSDQGAEFRKLLADNNVVCRHCSFGQLGQVTDSELGEFGHHIKFFNCLKCKTLNFDLFFGHKEKLSGLPLFTFKKILSFPDKARTFALPANLPQNIASDYTEASKLLSVSAAASSAFSRRCLQTILKNRGYLQKDLAKQIDALLVETVAAKVVPHYITVRLDAVRNFGNLSAHEIENRKTAEIVDVEPGEAEWCLEIIEDLIEHYFVRPAVEQAKIDRLNEKLRGAGKPEIKSPSLTDHIEKPE
jgi:hypothetical protein